MMRGFRWTAAVLTGLVAGCGGGANGGGYCVGSFAGGSSSWGCINCAGVNGAGNRTEFDRSIDNNSRTGTAFSLGPSSGEMEIDVRAPAGMSFPAGVDAGALISFPPGTFTSISVRFNTYRGNVQIDSLQGGQSATAGNVPGAGEAVYYSVSPTLEFDRLEAVIEANGGAEQAAFEVFEFCGDR